MSELKHMQNEADIGSGEQTDSEKKELIDEIKKIPVNGGAPSNAKNEPVIDDGGEGSEKDGTSKDNA